MTGPVKVSVIYYSATGTITELARTLAAEAEKAGAEVRLRKVAELAPDEANPRWRANLDATQDIPQAVADDVVWADAVLLGTPTRWGNVSAPLKHFIETLAGPGLRGELQDKAFSGFTASSSTHGGQESTLLALYNTVHHIGGIVVAPGYTDPAKYADGNPYGTSHVTAQGKNPVGDVTRAAAAVQAKRIVLVAGALRDGLARG
ncbi:flavodoxin family protein [Streptomyces sp. NPDC052236]|uniref:flavodoxin family protein n=1 Tax=Streptomyces sp. NPDC052236 TaxID=3365686 RepID=UPI0037CE6936